MTDFLIGVVSGALIIGPVGWLIGQHGNRRYIRRLQDIIMALDESGDEASWLRKFRRKR